MNRPNPRRVLFASLASVVAAGLVVLLVALLGPDANLHASLAPAWLTPALLLAFAATSLHQPLRRTLRGSPRLPDLETNPGLGLGTLVLPLALVSTTPLRTAILAAGGFLLAVVVRHLTLHFRLGPEPTGQPLSILAACGRIVLATAIAGWIASDDLTATGFSLSALLVAMLVFLAITTLAIELNRRYLAPEVDRRVNERVAGTLGLVLSSTVSITPEATGWLAGIALAAVSRSTSWGLTFGLVAVICALAVEAFRQAVERQAVEKRADDLEHLSRAGQRMAALGHGLVEIAEQIRTECRQVIAFHWFQFELLEEAGGYRSWWAGPRGMLQSGYPDPGPAPPALPGIHRRTAWKLVERTLTYEGRRVARLRLWCDPRLVESGDEEQVDELLPQMAASLQRSLLDREAREDPLTGALVRRVLERRLEDVFAKACDDGRPMAVVLCDIDHFKRINDRFGHEAGDRALVLVAHSLDQHRRDTDLCCRYGGEEFALLLEHADGTTALSIAERLRDAISELEFRPEDDADPVQLTISAGAASFPELFVQRPHDLLSLADKALYEAKDRGRNRALLNLGNGQYRTVAGEQLIGDPTGVPSPIEPPRLFV